LSLEGFFPGPQGQAQVPPRGYVQGYQQQQPFYAHGQGQPYQQTSNRGNNTPRQPVANQQPPIKQQVRTAAIQVLDNRPEEKPVANVPANPKVITKDGKSQPTCVVTPFVPLQVMS